MPVLCTDGEISDTELDAWDAGPLDVRVQLTRAQVRAVLIGPCLARGIALLGLTAGQCFKLFPSPTRRKNAQKLRCWAGRLASERVRTVLASATWHQLRAAALHDDENAQIRAAIAHTIGSGTAKSARGGLSRSKPRKRAKKPGAAHPSST